MPIGKNREIIIVDDNRDQRAAIISRLKAGINAYAFTFHQASCANSAKEQLSDLKKRVHIMVTDLVFKAGNTHGYQVLNEGAIAMVRHKILYCDPVPLDQIVAAMKNFKASDAVYKTIDHSMLVTKVCEHLDTHSEYDSEPTVSDLRKLFDSNDYRGKHIALVDGKVVAHSPTKPGLLKQLQRQTQGKRPYMLFMSNETIPTGYLKQ